MSKIHYGKCLSCGKGYKGRGKYFCSWSCYSSHAWAESECNLCRKRFRTRKQYLEKERMKYCSKECSYKSQSKYEIKVFNNEKYYFHEPSGYYVSLNGSRMHRDVWEYYNGEIPTGYVVHHIDEDKTNNIPTGYVVHHIDEDKTNNSIENLELMEWGEHTQHHHKKGISLGTFICKGCGKIVVRRMSDIKRGQNKFCSRDCSNYHRRRNEDGTFGTKHKFKKVY